MLTFQVILWLFCGSKDPSHLVQQDWICPNLSAMGNQSTNYLTGFNFQQYLAFVNAEGTTDCFFIYFKRTWFYKTSEQKSNFHRGGLAFRALALRHSL